MLDLDALCTQLEKILSDLRHTIAAVRAGQMPLCVCCNVMRVGSPGAMLCSECILDDATTLNPDD